ncbi:MAG: metallophosphoesterase family protein [Halothermotrichaceae bacterium]
MKLGIISDTHIPTKVKKLPEELLTGLQGVDMIIHAGDIAAQRVLGQLAEIAPVKAVIGNIDPPTLDLPLRLDLEINGYNIGIVHGHNLRGHIMDKLGYIFPEADIIIFGHTHIPCNKKINGQLYFNPGSPTDRRLQPRHSYGIINLGDSIKSQIIKF